MIALIHELINDRKGDPNKRTDVLIRALLLIVEGALIAWFTHKPFVDSLLLSISVFFLMFDYLINLILNRNKIIETKESWFTYLSKSWFDSIMKKISPWWRLGVKLGVLIVAILIYVL